MGKNKTDNLDQDSEAMLKEKTNQNFNKQKPNPKDPNQNKDHQSGEADGVERQIKKVTDKSDHLNKDSQSGDELNKFSTGNDEIELILMNQSKKAKRATAKVRKSSDH